MLGYLNHDDSPAGNARLASLADRLAAQGVRLAGAVQADTPAERPGLPCGMELRLLGREEPTIRISQSLGPGAQGCRLDSQALERAAGLAEATLPAADLLIVNKFGKVEAEGRGFRPLIGRAMLQGVPVLTAVAPAQRSDFLDFAGDLAEAVDPDGAVGWCLAVLADAARAVRA